jgi:hypothetical protein
VSAVLLMEVSADGTEWKRAATLAPGEREGSISHNWPDGKRDVILFACHGDHSMIRMPASGADFEDGDARMVITTGLREVARLGPGESFDMAVTTDRGLSYRVRWTHQAGDDEDDRRAAEYERYAYGTGIRL